jgi:hypothetical protein
MSGQADDDLTDRPQARAVGRLAALGEGLGALLLWSLVVWLPMLVHCGAKPVDEGKPEQSPSMLLLGVFSPRLLRSS